MACKWIKRVYSWNRMGYILSKCRLFCFRCVYICIKIKWFRNRCVCFWCKAGFFYAKLVLFLSRTIYFWADTVCFQKKCKHFWNKSEQFWKKCVLFSSKTVRVSTKTGQLFLIGRLEFLCGCPVDEFVKRMCSRFVMLQEFFYILFEIVRSTSYV